MQAVDWVASLLLSVAYSLLPVRYPMCSIITHHHHLFQWPCMVQVAVQPDSQQAAQQQQQGGQSAFAHAAADLNEDDEYLKLQHQPQVTPAGARNQYRRPARVAGRLAQLQGPPRPVEVCCRPSAGSRGVDSLPTVCLTLQAAWTQLQGPPCAAGGHSRSTDACQAGTPSLLHSRC